jgi:signal transduction histidine kinase
MTTPNMQIIAAGQRKSTDHLYHLFLETRDFSHFLHFAVEWIAACLNKTGGAIYIYYPFFGLPPDWISAGISAEWQNQLTDRSSQLNNLAYQTYLAQSPAESIPELQLSAIFPLAYQGRNLGVVALQGEAMAPADCELAAGICDDLSRLLVTQLHSSAIWFEKTEKDLLETIGNSVNLLLTDPNRSLLNLVQTMRRYFGAKYLLLLEHDPVFPELIFTHLLSNRHEWAFQGYQRISEKTLTYLQDPEKDEDCQEAARLELMTNIPELTETDIQHLACAPVRSANHDGNGYVILVDPDSRLNGKGASYLASSCALLADVLANVKSLEKMKIDMARLEVGQVELRNSRNNLRTLFDNIPLSIYIVDASYRLIIINKPRADKVNQVPINLVGKTCYKALFNRNSPCPACKVKDTLLKKKTTSRLWREWLTSETFAEWEIQTHPILDEMQNPVQAIVIEIDATEKRTLEANLIQSEKLAAVGQLAAGVAHEINNPLSAIIANAQILLEEVSGENIGEVESLKLIETAGIRASQVVRNLLSISHKENLEYELVDINTNIRNALVLVHHEILKSPITVRLELADNLPPVLAQQQHLQGVWINLLMNAIDAINAADRQEGVITVKTGASKDEVQIVVSDNGQGIPREKLHKVFEPFYTTKTVGHGTGLGLSVCMRVIKEHQGSISVESKPGQGTRFLVALPLGADNPTARE